MKRSGQRRKGKELELRVPRANRRFLRFAALLLIAVVSIYAFSARRATPAKTISASVNQPVSRDAMPTPEPNEPTIQTAEILNRPGPPDPKARPVFRDIFTYPHRTQFGRFAPISYPEAELEKMLRGKDEDIDLALANWLIAADIPKLASMTREGYFERIDAITAQVREAVNFRKTGPRGDAYAKCSTFCNAMIKLGFEYVEGFRSEDLTPEQSNLLHSDPDKTFLVGLLRTGRGSCASLPLLYVVIGQRIGLPVHLVTVKQHCFVRWEEPGLRLNIEATITDRVAVTDDDNVFLEKEGLSRDQIKDSSMRNLTRRETVGELFFNRSSYFQQHRAHAMAQAMFCLDLARANALRPAEDMFASKRQFVFTHYGITAQHTSNDLLPGIPSL